MIDGATKLPNILIEGQIDTTFTAIHQALIWACLKREYVIIENSTEGDGGSH